MKCFACKNEYDEGISIVSNSSGVINTIKSIDINGKKYNLCPTCLRLMILCYKSTSHMTGHEFNYDFIESIE